MEPEGGLDEMIEIPMETLHQLCLSLNPCNSVLSAMSAPSDPVFDDPDDDGAEDDTDTWDEFEYTAEVTGRQLGVQPVPRFQLYTIKAFEVMFIDNTDFPCAVRGGAIASLFFIAYKSLIKLKYDLWEVYKCSNSNTSRSSNSK